MGCCVDLQAPKLLIDCGAALIAGSIDGGAIVESRVWYIHRDGQQLGPFSSKEFDELVQRDELQPSDHIWNSETSDWQPASNLPEEPLEPILSVPKHGTELEGAPEPASRKKSWFSWGTIFWALVAIIALAIAAAEPGSIPYRLAGALNGALFGAIGGAIAAVLQYSVKRRLSAAPLGLAVALGFIVGQATEQSFGSVRDWVYSKFVSPRVTQELLVRQFDQFPIYEAMRRAVPEEHRRLRAEFIRLTGSGASPDEVQNYMETFTASVRRKHADDILSAPPGALVQILQTNGNMLDELNRRDPRMCSGFILEGFASQLVRPLVGEPAFFALVERNAVAVMDAIAAGAPRGWTYQPVNDDDVSVAVRALHERGWNDQMRAALGDPRQLASLPPEMTCRIFREWFATILSLPDPVRSRWLKEVLEPIIKS